MTKAALRVGVRVLYCLTDQDVFEINRRRKDWNQTTVDSRGDATEWQQALGHSGLQAHVGNQPSTGEWLPGLIVSDWGQYVNLQVFMDGNDSHWVTSVSEADMSQDPTGHWVIIP